MSRFIQGSWCDDEGCPRDYEFEKLQRALDGTDKKHLEVKHESHKLPTADGRVGQLEEPADCF